VLSVVRQEAAGRTLKVIVESGELPGPAAVDRAAMLAIECGADFVKTSTGKTPVSATPEAAEIILEAIAVSGRPVGLKVSGGIRTVDDARAYLELADRIMGPGWATPATFRFGASSLLDALEATLA
jgi:deoxyribose-phosphate aldolase